MAANKDEAARCAALARGALAVGELQRAEKFATKAMRMDPCEEHKGEKGAVCGNASSTLTRGQICWSRCNSAPVPPPAMSLALAVRFSKSL